MRRLLVNLYHLNITRDMLPVAFFFSRYNRLAFSTVYSCRRKEVTCHSYTYPSHSIHTKTFTFRILLLLVRLETAGSFANLRFSFEWSYSTWNVIAGHEL